VLLPIHGIIVAFYSDWKNMISFSRNRLFLTLGLVCVLLTCVPVSGQSADGKVVPVTIETLPVNPAAEPCTGRFVTHELDHITTVPDPKKIQMFEGNGEGVAINDLDDDGRLDIVLGNYSGPNTILWNNGKLNFSTQHLTPGDARAVTVVDVDGDGKLDIVFSQTKNAPAYWHNDGNREFTRQYLPGVGKPLYAINWADVNNDSYLDLVGATYDASLLASSSQDLLTNASGGVYVYESKGNQYMLRSLAISAQALALILIDLNGDGHQDIWVGNDFAVPDQIWFWSKAGWQRTYPLKAMSYSTMSLDFGDLDNDGRIEVFSADMKPYPDDTLGQVALVPILNALAKEPRPANDRQVMANVLQTVQAFKNTAEAAGVDATGWSWSSKFGDLDQDGFLDLYVVNGFMELTTFAKLPNHELVEENQAFRNDGTGKFVRMPEWGLGSTRSGRGMSMADLDGDGDLDVVVNNVNSGAQLFENEVCGSGSLQVDLFWPGSHNTRAIGSTLVLITDTATYSRNVKAASGYLSGDPARVHFGFPKAVQLRQLQIRWPDGAKSNISTLESGSTIAVTRAG
jgi:enediyne biosynthesis protein E4